jgi:hypothetical protein
LVFFFILLSCRGAPEPVVVLHDPLTLQEIAPLPRAVLATLAAPQVIIEVEPVYTNFRIVEVSEVNGVQRYFIVRVGANRAGISVGGNGEIAEDEAFQRVIGNYRIAAMYGDFFRAEITSLTHRIGVNAFARIQTGEIVREVFAN